MKKLLVFFSVYMIFLYSGCSDNNIIEPVTGLEKPNTIINNSHKDIIYICCPLQDPLSGACNLVGNVIYAHQILPENDNTNGLVTVLVNLEMNTELCDMLGMMHPQWAVTGTSEDIVYVSEEGIVLLTKTYPVCNRTDIVLIVKYLITTEGVGIGEMYITDSVTSFNVAF
jgi:hypothetical protein